MTIVSHQHQLIFLKPRKTAGTSIERALSGILGPEDWIATSTENEPLALQPFVTPNLTAHSFRAERALKRLLRRVGPKALRLREHMPAEAVRGLVGRERWARYRKVSVVRDPWRRMLSLWRWRARRDGIDVDFEGFLGAIESADREREKRVGARRWSNLPFYFIDGQLVLDRLLRFEHLDEDFREFQREFGLPETGPLPQLKVMAGQRSDPVETLTPDQIERIATLCADEIEWFGYRPPG
ncbi:MAG: sulfotransferase family 2 domain-containing protein [Gammaproteobacteria bacterium]|jgi:hypothetical protein|nr:sulfotransferase family 2 domain-containing protein [Gammaproteobacteria bacterium]